MTDEIERIGPTPERAAKAPHGVVDVMETVSAGGNRRKAGKRLVTPLDDLRYNDRISDREFEAGRQYYVDYYYAEKPSQGVMRWREFISGSHAATDLDHTERVAFHSKRFADANKALGPLQSAVLRLLVVEEMPCFQIGAQLLGYRHKNGASAAGMTAAITALDTLARHYGLR